MWPEHLISRRRDPASHHSDAAIASASLHWDDRRRAQACRRSGATSGPLTPTGGDAARARRARHRSSHSRPRRPGPRRIMRRPPGQIQPGAAATSRTVLPRGWVEHFAGTSWRRGRVETDLSELAAALELGQPDRPAEAST